jgi:hypothetical protein
MAFGERLAREEDGLGIVAVDDHVHDDAVEPGGDLVTVG